MFKHGLSTTRAYRSYKSMMNRCTNVKAISYKYYGGRPSQPVKVCQRWLDRKMASLIFMKTWETHPFLIGRSIELTPSEIIRQAIVDGLHAKFKMKIRGLTG